MTCVFVCGVLPFLLTFMTMVGLAFFLGAFSDIYQQYFVDVTDLCHFTHTTLFDTPIPKHIHFIDWESSSNHSHYRKCSASNPGYSTTAWTPQDVHLLLSKEYHWILPLYSSIQQSHLKEAVAKLFILHHLGGAYVPVSSDCVGAMDTVLDTLPSWKSVIFHGQWTLYGDSRLTILAAKPKHPFLMSLIYKLPVADLRQGAPCDLTASARPVTRLVQEVFDRFPCKNYLHGLAPEEYSTMFGPAPLVPPFLDDYRRLFPIIMLILFPFICVANIVCHWSNCDNTHWKFNFE